MRKPDYPAPVRAIVKWLFGLFGWHMEGEVPNYPKLVAIGAPHTSNWDGLVMYGLSIVLGAKFHWLGKKQLFRFPIGWLMRAAGGVPVNRETGKNAVDTSIEVFNERDRFILVIAPEGTRRYVDHWKTGFYYIALGANVPIVMGWVDYGGKRAGLGPILHPTGDIEADFEVIKAFYDDFSDKRGRFPANEGKVALPSVTS
jgi:1-acyl-sn-glycerol-3-phosphate acyltransferase